MVFKPSWPVHDRYLQQAQHHIGLPPAILIDQCRGKGTRSLKDDVQRDCLSCGQRSNFVSDFRNRVPTWNSCVVRNAGIDYVGEPQTMFTADTIQEKLGEALRKEALQNRFC